MTVEGKIIYVVSSEAGVTWIEIDGIRTSRGSMETEINGNIETVRSQVAEYKQTLDEFIHIMRQIAQEAKDDPEMVKTAPHNTPVRRLDDTLAALHPVVTWRELQAENY